MTEQLPRDAIVVGVELVGGQRPGPGLGPEPREAHPPAGARGSTRSPSRRPPSPRTKVVDGVGRTRAGASSPQPSCVVEMHGVPMSGQSLEDVDSDPGDALVELCRGASMLVVGARGHSAVAGLLAGSVSQYAARHAPCPVVAVRPAHDHDSRRVVVGVDYTPEAHEAIGFAFQLASDLRVDLTAIHTWHAASLHGAGTKVLPMPADVGTRCARPAPAADDLAMWQQKFPTVPLTVEAVPGHAAAVLVDASEHAGIVVVGGGQRQSVTGALLGSVSEKLLHHARCPVVVARDDNRTRCMMTTRPSLGPGQVRVKIRPLRSIRRPRATGTSRSCRAPRSAGARFPLGRLRAPGAASLP